MSDTKVSVIIPVYNTGEYLKEAIDSILSQTLDGIEIIAVNDGSTDNSAEILDGYGDRITVITKKNAGQAAARNDALKIAGGRYIYFMDSDDWIDADTLERCYELCERDNLDFCFFDGVSFGEEETGSGWQDYHRAALYGGIRKGHEAMAEMLKDGRYRCTVCMSLFRMSFLQKYGIRFRAGIIHEDELFSAQVYFNANRIESLNAEFYHRRLRGESTMTRKFSKRNVDGYMTVIAGCLEYVRTVAPEARKACRRLVSTILLSMMQNGYSLPAAEKMRVVGAVIRHPYSFRFRPFCILLLKGLVKRGS